MISQRPWYKHYEAAGLPETVETDMASGLDLFRRTVTRDPRHPFLHYFDNTLSAGDVDRLSDALAVALEKLGVQRGDRVAVYMQNMPQFVLTMLASWKLGAIMVSVNPMYRQTELARLLKDSGAVALVLLESLYRDVAAEVVGETPVKAVVTTSELDFLAGERPNILQGVERLRLEDTHDLVALLDQNNGEAPPEIELSGEDIAFLTYTSGTTGASKGAMNSHGNVASMSTLLCEWNSLDQEDVILALAPLFHITGLIVHVTLAFASSAALALFYRFDPATAARMVEKYRASYTAGAITAFIALMNDSAVEPYDLSTLQKIHSGGAPNPPAALAEFESKYGVYLHGAYGLTEASSATHYVPFGARAPVDPESGASSIGVPVCGIDAHIIDADGNELPPGEVGEIAIRSPGVVPGYWNKPEETAQAIRNGELRTGDVGFMDAEGWFYVVDRMKDMIIASGFKVWPREVEDVLYAHPAVREAAVVGVGDAYRGETVKAFVSLKPGEACTSTELIDHCRGHLAAYKRPSEVAILEELPKNPGGKILRRELRDSVT